MATEMLRDIDADTVDFVPNYDESRREPSVLPSRFPNLLVNGSSGIAVGMATNIPPHNLGEVVDAIVAMIDNPTSTSSGCRSTSRARTSRPAASSSAAKASATPTAPAAAASSSRAGAHRGAPRRQDRDRRHRAAVRREEGRRRGVIEKIADLVNDKVLERSPTRRDQSDKDGMRIVIELKRDAVPQVVLNKLYKHTPLQTTFGYNAVALVDGVPRTLSLSS